MEKEPIQSLFEGKESEEIESLRLQLKTLKELFKSSRNSISNSNISSSSLKTPLPKELMEENQRYKLRIEKLTTAIIEREKKITQLQNAQKNLVTLSSKINDVEQRANISLEELKKETNSRREAQEEVVALQAQLDILKSKFLTLKEIHDQKITEFHQIYQSKESLETHLATSKQELLNKDAQLLELNKTFEESKNQIQSLKTTSEQQIDTFLKSHTNEKQELVSERDRLKQQLEVAKQIIEQKEERLLLYQRDNEEAQVKQDHLKSKNTSLEDHISSLENRHLENVQNVMAELAKTRAQLDHQSQEKTEALEEAKALLSQLDSLKTKFTSIQEKALGFETENQELKKEHSYLLKQYQTVKTLFEKQEETLSNTQNVLKEREQQLEILHDCQQKLERLNKDEKLWFEEKNQYIKQNNALQESIEQKEERILYLQNTSEAIQKHLQEALLEKQKLLEEISTIRNREEDAEKRLKIAHQHLAKKVRECTDLKDKLEVVEMQFRDSTIQLDHSRNQINELQTLSAEQLQQEKRLKEQYEDSLKSAEALSVAWEEKYSKLYHRLKESESALEELRKLEEKHRLMQSAWAGLGSYFQETLPLSPLPPPLPPAKESDAQIEPNSMSSPRRKPYQNLFDLPKNPYPQSDSAHDHHRH